jgi:AraC-like DNA-binding protein
VAQAVKITLVATGRPELTPWLIGYVGGEIAAGPSLTRRVIPARPNCFVQIILSGRHAMADVERKVRQDAPVAGLFGPLTHYHYDMEIPGDLRTFSARLQPAAASQLFGIDPGQLVDTFRPLELPLGLLEGLRAAPDFTAMAALVDDWLVQLAKGKRGTDAVTSAANHLRHARGIISVQELADESGLSLRQFQRRFQALTGLNPKHYARLCRIGQAVHRKELEPTASWTDLALECGYADQSHFIRDFKALTGTVPRNFLRGQTPILREPKWEG